MFCKMYNNFNFIYYCNFVILEYKWLHMSYNIMSQIHNAQLQFGWSNQL